MDLRIWTDLRARWDEPPTAADYDDGIELVRAAERLGLHCVWTTEQHGVDDGYLPAQLPVLAAFARETTTIRLGAGVILLPLAHPRHVVEEACVVDVLSHGRLTLGLGAGNFPNEFRIFGADLADRAKLMDEGVEFVKAGLAGGRLPDGGWVNVPPVQQPVPLVLGGLTRPAIERAARLAGGHFVYAFEELEQSLRSMYQDVIAPAIAHHDRHPDNFRLIFGSMLWASDKAEREWRDVVGPTFQYQQRKYQEWEDGVQSAGGYGFEGDLEELQARDAHRRTRRSGRATARTAPILPL